MKWPQDNQSARNAFYGDPAKGEIGPRMVAVVPPFAMYYGKRRVKTIQFHRLCAPALRAALDEIWDYYEHDQNKIDAAGASKYAGAYNPRKVRGSATKWSNHAYAAAIDINAEENGLYQRGNMPQPVIDAFCRQGAMWGGWYRGRKDPMHFEFVDNHGHAPEAPRPSWPRAAAPEPEQNVPLDELDYTPAKPLRKSKIVQGATIAATAGAGNATDAAHEALTKMPVETAGNVDSSALHDALAGAPDLLAQAKDAGLLDKVVPTPGLLEKTAAVMSSPRFLLGVLIVMVCAGIAYWRWRDHQ